MSLIDNLPPLINNYASFRQHIDSWLEGRKGHDKGDPWQEFSKSILPFTDFGRRFVNLRNNSKKTRDSGWDIQGKTEDNADVLFVDAKYSVNDVKTLSGVVDAWTLLAGVPSGQLTLGIEGATPDKTNTHFAIVTLSDVHSHIEERYRRGGFPSSAFYNRWLDESRVAIIDGPQIWAIVRDIYLKGFADPQPRNLKFESGYVQFGNVYLGVIAASELRRIYQESGNAIFFENVRDFAGETDVNQEIAQTITKHPNEFLQLNNGIVFSSSQVTQIDNKTLHLERANIVNGCQTTVTIGATKPTEECYLQVKVIQISSQEGWKVTHAANFQNEIKRIDLDLAKYIRPQMVKKQGYWSGVPVSTDNAQNILNAFTRQNITWRNIRILFIGLFSRDPGNMFDVRWDLVNDKLLNHFFQSDRVQNEVFDVVFELHLASEQGSTATSNWLRKAGDEESLSLFSRLLGDNRAPYMQFLGILAICALINVNIAERDDDLDSEADRMRSIFLKFTEVLSSRRSEFTIAYAIAFEKISTSVLEQAATSDIESLRRKMYDRITKKDTFTNFFRQVKIGINLRLQTMPSLDD